jgi:hypothetical protein
MTMLPSSASNLQDLGVNDSASKTLTADSSPLNDFNDLTSSVIVIPG